MFKEIIIEGFNNANTYERLEFLHGWWMGYLGGLFSCKGISNTVHDSSITLVHKYYHLNMKKF